MSDTTAGVTLAQPRGAAAIMLARAEFRAGIRSAAFRIVAALAFLLGWSVGGAPGRGVGLSAYPQIVGAYVLLGIALLAGTQWLYRSRRRGGRPVSIWVRIAAPLALVLSVWAFWSNVRNGHDPQTRLQPGMERLTEQTVMAGS